MQRSTLPRAAICAVLCSAPFGAASLMSCELFGDDDGGGSSGSSGSTSCTTACRSAQSAGCLERGFDCDTACEQQARIDCDGASESLYTCARGNCSDVDQACSSEVAALTACRDDAAPQACVAQCLDVENRGCNVSGTFDCERLCSNAVAAGCATETNAALECLVEQLDAGQSCSGSSPPAACQDELDALDGACETLEG